MAVSGGWNNFIELSLSIDEWITIEISQVNQGGKVREISIYVLTLHIKLQIIRKVPFTQKIFLKL